MSLNMISTAKATFCIGRYINYNLMVNGFHQSCVRAIKIWRMKRGLTPQPNKDSLLTNLPDYTFKVGKPTPLGIRQKARLDKQREYAARIIELVKEVDFAVERHAKMQEEKMRSRQEILNNKLKPKGDLLLQIKAKEVK
ncbi:PREDICTED: 39S ribosomal protein L52, mitochondrial [Dinoponera quadriceps]|uniref:Large ribosomal subunit protein mL52 n=1 Tax=Dinoponera quadriceps TaxID=609295 RepID=A0A6P3YG03_DINQU|nr:PREDICTED: 39S ribosomal protein L52, mitochondrial [Dinoponera quadriceps]